MAADSLALALPLPCTVLWIEEIWATAVWIWLSTSSFLVRKRYRKTPPTASAAKTTRVMMVFRTLFRFLFFCPLDFLGVSGGAGVSTDVAFCSVISAMLYSLLNCCAY